MVRTSGSWNLLDEDLLQWSMELKPNAQLVLSLIEARQVIEPAAARFAAHRASEDDIADLDETFANMARFKESQDFAAFNEADIAFHKALLRASANVVFQQLADMIGAALAYSFRLTTQLAREPGSSLPNHGEVVDRIRARDPEGAFHSMARLLDIALVDLSLGRDR